jgi:nitrous oxide reductase
MPRHDTQSSPAEGVSRRSVIRGAATAGAAGLAVTALGGALSPAASAATRSPSSAARTQAPARAEGETAGPIVVHVRNTKSGDIEVFSGTSQTRLHDKDLAARIARAIG